MLEMLGVRILAGDVTHALMIGIFTILHTLLTAVLPLPALPKHRECNLLFYIIIAQQIPPQHITACLSKHITSWVSVHVKIMLRVEVACLKVLRSLLCRACCWLKPFQAYHIALTTAEL